MEEARSLGVTEEKALLLCGAIGYLGGNGTLRRCKELAGSQPTEAALLDALAQMECSKIYVMLGVNELGWKGTDIFRNQSTELIRRLQEDHPDAEIVIQSILPVSAKIDDEGRYVNNGRINEYNQIWLELAEEFHVNYMNVAEVLLDENGQLPAELTYDGVHLNKAGCRQWLDYLRTHAVGDFQDVIAPAVVETEAPSEPILSAAEN
jgi:lysophospholipase L1-like esterase